MKFFIDTANVDEIRKANDMGVISGVTTNPSLIAKLMAKLKKHILPWMTVVLTVFMAVNMGLSGLALARYDARTSGLAPANRLDVFLDEHFDNARMERVYPNAKKT